MTDETNERRIHDKQYAAGQSDIKDLIGSLSGSLSDLSTKSTTLQLTQNQAAEFLHQLHSDHRRLEARVTKVEKEVSKDTNNLEKHVTEAVLIQKYIQEGIQDIRGEQKELKHSFQEHTEEEARDRKDVIKHLQSTNTKILWAGISVAASVVTTLFVLLWKTGILT